MDKVSVIIPVHNGERYVQKTVQRILDQDYKEIEIILVENNSTDNSLAMCRQLEKENPRVVALTTTEKGTSLARKRGVEWATGKYILFCD